MTNKTLVTDVESVEEQIWINSYLFAVARLNPHDASAIADDAVDIYSKRWGRTKSHQSPEEEAQRQCADHHPFPKLPTR